MSASVNGTGLPLHDDRAERARLAADGHRQEHREALLADAREVLVGRVLLGRLGRDGAHVLDRLAGDALADAESHLPDRGVREADVAAHDELALVALEEVQRADLGLEERHDAPGRLVEQREERHRPRGERDEVEHAVESLVASLVDARAGRACHPTSHCRPEYRRTSAPAPSPSRRAPLALIRNRARCALARARPSGTVCAAHDVRSQSPQRSPHPFSVRRVVRRVQGRHQREPRLQGRGQGLDVRSRRDGRHRRPVDRPPRGHGHVARRASGRVPGLRPRSRARRRRRPPSSSSRSYARWKEVIRKQLDPTKGMMQNKLKLTKGHMPTMVKYVNASKELVESTTRVPTPLHRRVRTHRSRRDASAARAPASRSTPRRSPFVETVVIAERAWLAAAQPSASWVEGPREARGSPAARSFRDQFVERSEDRT